VRIRPVCTCRPAASASEAEWRALVSGMREPERREDGERSSTR
jgi:hypothetical protein